MSTTFAAPPRRQSGWLGWVFWWPMMLLSIGVGGYALFHAFNGFALLPETVRDNAHFNPGVMVHVGASGIALILGPFQFLRGLRARAPSAHRWSGRAYVAACLIGGAGGAWSALTTSAGPVAGWGFMVLAILWLLFTSLALAAAMRRDFVSHEKWMVRSFALTFGAVMLRLQLPIGVSMTGGDFFAAYQVIAWAAWVPNLIVAEIWMASRRTSRARSAA
jgi:hypothetical protein